MRFIIIIFSLLLGIWVNAQQSPAKLYKISEENKKIRQEQLRLGADFLKKLDQNNPDLVFDGFYHGIPYFMETHSENVKASSNIDLLYNNTIPGVSLDGSSLTLYQWDGGHALTTHQEFGGRLTNASATEEDDTTTPAVSGHPTYVAGVMGASGVMADAQGVAYAAQIKNYSNDYFTSEVPTAAANGALISNHSYGWQGGWRVGDYGEGNGWYWFGLTSLNATESNLYGYYDGPDYFFDQIAYNAINHTIVKSCGNDRTNSYKPTPGQQHYVLDDYNYPYTWSTSTDVRPNNCASGYDCLPPGSMAKNIIQVGAIEAIEDNFAYDRYMTASDVVFANYTSFGPTDDGRIKPDIMAVGTGVYVPTNLSDTSYGNNNGTSFSSPAVASTLGLLQELYHGNFNAYMNANMSKALLLNSTYEAGSNPGPDYRFGWGLMNALEAAQTIENTANSTGSQMITAILANSGTATYSFKAIGNSKPIRATLVWLDPPSIPLTLAYNDRTPMLINDIDLRIVDTDTSTTHFPWILDPDNPANAATQGDNAVDNVEQILIDAPVADRVYTFQISHKGTLLDDTGNTADSNYALVISGVVPETASVNDYEWVNEMQLTPNPATDFFEIRSAKQLNLNQISLYDTTGKMVKEWKDVSSQDKFDVSNLSPGAYVILMELEEQKIYRKLLVR